MFHEMTKHIDVSYHFVHDIIARGDIVVSKVGTQDNHAQFQARLSENQLKRSNMFLKTRLPSRTC